MVKIRLTRKGTRKRPLYRVVVADSRCARDGKTIENIGFFDPTKNRNEIVLRIERYRYWVERGAQVSERVRSLFKQIRADRTKILDRTP